MKLISISAFMTLVFFVETGCNSNKVEIITFNAQLGTYVLDLNKTDLGIYAKDSSVYKNLCITFNEDSTFITNMKVPFMYDSIGKWIAGDGSPYSFNQLFYKSFNYDKEGTGEHFFPPFSQDSLFLLNSTTPQKGEAYITEIYFKKIKI